MNVGFSGASRWSASESFLGGYLFDRNYGNFSTGVDKSFPYLLGGAGNVGSFSGPSSGHRSTAAWAVRVKLTRALRTGFTAC